MDATSPAYRAYANLRKIICYTNQSEFSIDWDAVYMRIYKNYVDAMFEIIEITKSQTNSRKNKELTIVFKMHHLLHYPRQVAYFGGFNRSNVRQYERVHQTYKQVARESKNRINIPKTFASYYVDHFSIEQLESENQVNCSTYYTDEQLSKLFINSEMHRLFFNQIMALLNLRNVFCMESTLVLDIFSQ